MARQAAEKRFFATRRQPAVSLSRRCTSRGRWPSRLRIAPSMPSIWRVVPDPPCTASPIGLLSTITSSSSNSVMDLMKARSLCSAGLSAPGRGASSRSGGMRIDCPASSRPFGCARLPFTRTSPLRMMRWIWLKDSPGNGCSKKRSTRMPFSSARDGHGLDGRRQWRAGGRLPGLFADGSAPAGARQRGFGDSDSCENAGFLPRYPNAPACDARTLRSLGAGRRSGRSDLSVLCDLLGRPGRPAGSSGSAGGCGISCAGSSTSSRAEGEESYFAITATACSTMRGCRRDQRTTA